MASVYGDETAVTECDVYGYRYRSWFQLVQSTRFGIQNQDCTERYNDQINVLRAAITPPDNYKRISDLQVTGEDRSIVTRTGQGSNDT